MRVRLTIALAIVSLFCIAISAVVGVVVVGLFFQEHTLASLKSAAVSTESDLRAVGGVTIRKDRLSALFAPQSMVVLVAKNRRYTESGIGTAEARTLVHASLAGQLEKPSPVSPTLVGYSLSLRPGQLTVLDGQSHVVVQRVILATDTKKNQQIKGDLITANSLGGLVGLLALILVASIVVGRNLRPLAVMADSAEALARGDKTARLPLDGRDQKIDRLAATVNSAFDSQQDAENRARSFVADASHELRTPLTTATGWVELWLAGGLTDPERQQHAMQKVHAQLSRIREMTEELALLARLDEARPLASDPVDVDELVADVVADVRMAWPNRLIAVERQSGEHIVLADHARLAQVIRNLLNNAAQHTPSNAIIEVLVTNSPDGLHQRIDVKDSGPGIPPESLPHLFERFWRADASRSTSAAAGGSGLGLAISQSIVTALGGTISVRSVANEGSTFTVQLARTLNTLD